jgi:hypothetical protein
MWAEKLDVHGSVREGGDCAINVGSKDPTKILSVLRKFDATSYQIHVPGDL